MNNTAGLQSIKESGRPNNRLLLLLWVVWLPYLFHPVQSFVSGHPSPLSLIIALFGSLLYVGIYLGMLWYSELSRPYPAKKGIWVTGRWTTSVSLIILSSVLILNGGRDWLVFLILTSATIGLYFPNIRGLSAVAGVMILSLAAGWLTKAGWVDTVKIIMMVGFVGLNVINVVRTLVTNRELRAAKEEIARLAVNEERLRFARDLHDLLGHDLSHIALKSEMAEYLAVSDPARSIKAMREVASSARIALKEVREAVAGYRQPSLTNEIRAAAEILTAAGIEFKFSGDAEQLSPATEAVLAWTVREGVTNVIKHSRAKQCTIEMQNESHDVTLAICDDGKGMEIIFPSPERRNDGHGLIGLTERIASIGGCCEFVTPSSGGFQLRVMIPAKTNKYVSVAKADEPTK
jgi:two-component system sensor histidine kinase DesK